MINGMSYSGKVWRGEGLVNLVDCPWFAKLKPSNLVLTIDNLLADLLIHQTFLGQMLKKSQFTKLSCYTVKYLQNCTHTPTASGFYSRLASLKASRFLGG